MKHPFSIPDPPPAAHDDSAAHDQLDDDFWFDQIFRSPKLVSWLPIERMSERLKAAESTESQRRAESDPEEHQEQWLRRERRLLELVLLANETDNPELWRRVDAVVSGQNAPTEAL